MPTPSVVENEVLFRQVPPGGNPIYFDPSQNQHLRRIARDCGIYALSYLPTPDELDNQHGVPRAHCVITEINRTDYDSDTTAKKRIKEWALGVADFLGENDIVGPFEKPADHDHYRPATDCR